VRVLLVSTYDLGRQPFGLASPAAWLRRAGVEVDCADTSRESLSDDAIRRADAVALYLPMHTATRLAAAAIERTRVVNPDATLIAYGLYAPLNAAWLRERGRVVYLRASIEQQLARTRHGTHRPLLNNADPRGTLEQLMAVRAPLYEEIAEIVANTDGRKVNTVVEDVLRQMHGPG